MHAIELGFFLIWLALCLPGLAALLLGVGLRRPRHTPPDRAVCVVIRKDHQHE